MKGILLSVFGAGILGALYFQCGTDEDQKRPQDRYLLNRVWADKKMSDPRQSTFRMALMDKAKQRLGMISSTSMWRLHFEILRYRTDKNRLTLESPQDGQRFTLKYRTWRCKEAPKPFDLCLELKHDRGRMVLYSREDAAFASDQSLDYLMEGDLSGWARWPNPDEVNAACDECQEGLPEWFAPGLAPSP